MTTDNNLDFTQQHTLEPWTVNNFRITPGLPERRRHKRIAIALPVILEIATGVTRDVSASGAFFWVSGTYAIGEPISFGMGRKTEAGKSMLKCRGVVVRTEPRGDDVGVAVRVTGSPMEPVPSHLRGPDLLKSAHDQPSNITQRKDDALASAIKTVDRWSMLLRNKALEAREELQGQEVLGWAIPSAADGTTPQSLRVRVCSVTVVGVVSHVSQVLGHRGIPGGKYRDLDQLHSNAETNARRNATEVGVGVKNKFVKSRNPHDGCSVRIDLEVYVANASQDESTLDKAPLPKVVVRTTSVGGDDHRQEFDENRHTRKSYGDPTEAFEAFLMLAIESAILINLGSHRVNG
jgi:hypothetical protein